MTNREWLETLSDEELASKISTRCGLCANHDVNDCWDCASNITTWLTQEYKPPILERVSKPDRGEKAMTIQEILGYLDNVLYPIVTPDNWDVYAELHNMIGELPFE